MQERTRQQRDGGTPHTARLCLTFDDGPDREWTARVLEALDRGRARATFFVLGERVMHAPQTVRAILDAGHDVQLHGHRHLRHSETDDCVLARDTQRALDALAGVGVHPTLWRAPWGVCTEATMRLARHHGLRLVDWTIDSEDWRGDGAAAMLARIVPRLHTGGVVLMHDAVGPGATRAGCADTVELVDRLIEHARRGAVEVGPL